MKRIIPLLAFVVLVSCMGEMTGVISVKGNEPHTYTAFTTENGELYKVDGPLSKELREKYQGTRVKIKAKLIKKKEKPGFGPGVIEVSELVEVYKY
ncbi:MAG TPA: hypothetical protein PLY36_02530 [Spirochaetota bacterium]|nr:hypothetical protein [Spirochaetota bacterium]